MKPRPRNLADRVIELERQCPSKQGSRFFMIWGKNDADCTAKLKKANADGELKRGDRFDMKIWTKPAPIPGSRWTSFRQMMDDEDFLVWHEATAARSEKPEIGPPSRDLLQYSTEELCELITASLPCVA
jgi:hypothetical protein